MSFRTHPGKRVRSGSLFATDEPKTAAKTELVAFVDGGARGNPGPAGFGVHIEDASGQTVAEFGEFLGHATNNVAEYSGLLAALDYAIRHGHHSVQVVSDSELLVKQLRGEYKVKSPDLRPLYDRARKMIAGLKHFEVRHVLRAQNRHADRLANEAMDKGMGRGSAPPVVERTGVVRGGVVELLDGALPEGTRVRVRPVSK